jgi:hypothetical protein
MHRSVFKNVGTPAKCFPLFYLHVFRVYSITEMQKLVCREVV